jgi:ribosome-associated protein
MPLVIRPDLVIPDEEFEWRFIRASGPGGQNVNKVSSAAQLRFLLAANTSLPADAKRRLRRLAGHRLVDDGSILIAARSERSQEQNRREALGRLEALIREALIEPKIRKRTRPTKGSKERRLDSKKRRGSTKTRAGTEAPGEKHGARDRVAHTSPMPVINRSSAGAAAAMAQSVGGNLCQRRVGQAERRGDQGIFAVQFGLRQFCNE